MATIDNRSAFTVSVARRPKLTQQFAFKRRREAEAYMKALVQQGLNPDIEQAADRFQVRVRRKRTTKALLTNVTA